MHTMVRPLRWAMIGGGQGSQIGYIHRSAAARDGMFSLTAGAFDIDPQRSKEFGISLGLDCDRCYGTYQEMFAAEAAREDGIEVVSIATPNRFHYEMSKAALEANLHVICEKPLTFTVKEAEELRDIAQKKHRIIGVMYGYSGYQMIHQARAMIARGDIGDVRIISMQFAHGWHSEEVEAHDPGTKWRVTPEVAGPTYVLGDIATHVLYLAQLMVPDFSIEKLMCSRQSFIPSRAPLEDNAFVLMQLAHGAVAQLWASAVNAGAIHNQKIRVVGSKASLEWWDEHPNQLSYEVQGKPKQLLDRGAPYLEQVALSMDRIGSGHAEGLFESWANIYHRFALVMHAADQQDTKRVAPIIYPDIESGLEGVRFIENCVRSSNADASWVDYV